MDFRSIARALSLDPDRLIITRLTGGVSSDIYLLEQGHTRLVAKQSVAKLRVAADWPVARERIWREVDVLRMLAPVCAVPHVLYEDREAFLYVMTAAPVDAEPWKARLMRGEADPLVARRIGEIQAVLLDQSGFEDQAFFEQLRIDPYYTFTATRYPELAQAFARATHACRENRWGLVHGDWSPKNIMVDNQGGVLALDFECVHYGDPAYDAAFLLNHLVLKTFHRPARADSYAACAEAFLAPLHRIAFAAIMVHLPVLLLARLDGKSPAEYIHHAAPVRDFACRLLAEPPATAAGIWLRLKG